MPCRAALATFRELGDTWAMAVALVQLAQFARLRADYETAIEYLQEAVSLGRELGAWATLSTSAAWSPRCGYGWAT